MAGSNTATVGWLRIILSADTAEFDSAMKKVSASADRWTKDLKNIGQQATAVGSTLTKAFTVPLVAVWAGAAKLAMDFESSFAGVGKTVDGVSDKTGKLTEVGQQLAQSFRDLSKTIPVNVNELNNIGAAAGALGIKKENLVEFTETMALLGVTTNLTSDQAATSIAQIQNIFNAAGKDTKNFASALVALGNDGASTESQIVDFASRLAGAGHQIGLSEQQVLGFGAALANVGLNAELGGTALSKVMSKMSVEVDKGGKKLDEFARIASVGLPKSLQLTGQAFAALFKKDAAAAITAYIEGLGRAGKAGQNLTIALNDVGLKGSNVQDVMKRLAGAGDQVRTALDLSAKAWKDNTALSEEATKRFATTEAKLTLLWNRVKDVGITLGNALLPTITRSIEALDRLIPVLNNVATWFAKLDPATQTWVIGIGAAVAAAGPLLVVFGQMALGAASITALFTKKGLATKALATSMDGLATSSKGLSTAMGGAVLGVAVTSTMLAMDSLEQSTRANIQAVKDGNATWSDIPGVLENAVARGLNPFGAAWRDITEFIHDAKTAWDIFRGTGTDMPAVQRPGVAATKPGQNIDLSAGAEGALVLTDATRDLNNVYAELDKRQQDVNDSSVGAQQELSAKALREAAAATEKANAAADKFNATQDKLLETMRSAGIMTQEVVATGLEPFIQQLNLAAQVSETQLFATLVKLTPQLLAMAEAMKTAGMDTKIVTDLLDAFNRKAGLSAEAMAAWERSLPLRPFTELMPMVQGFSVETEIANTRTEQLSDSFRTLGTTSRDSLGRIANDAKLAYETISTELGRTSPEAIEAFKKWQEAARVASGHAADAFAVFGLKSRDELQSVATQAELAYKDIVATVGSRAPEAIAAHQKMVEAINAATLTIAQTWQDKVMPRIVQIVAQTGQAVDAHLTDIVVGASAFKEGFLKVWLDIKTGVASTVTAIVQNAQGKLFGPLVKGFTDLFPQTKAVMENITLNVSHSFGEMLSGAVGFKDGFINIWHEIKKGIGEILTAILQDFEQRFLKGLLGMLTGQQGAFSQAFAGLLSGGTGGTSGVAQNAGILGKLLGAGGSAGMVGMGSTATMFGGNATAAAIAADPALAGSTAAGFGSGGAGLSAGLAGGAAAAGAGIIMGMIGKKIFGGAGWKASGFGAASGAATGALIGSVVPVLGTAVGAIIGGLAGAIAGWVGKTQQMKVNDARDEITAKFGENGTGEGSGFANLAAKLTEATGEAGGGHLFDAFAQAKTMKEFQAAVEAIIPVLEAYDKKQKDAAASAADLAAKTDAVNAKLKEQTDALNTQMDGLNADLAKIDASEAPEEHMGHVERAARDRIAAQQAIIKSQIKAVEDEAAAALKAIEDAAKGTSGAIATAADDAAAGAEDAARRAREAFRKYRDEFDTRGGYEPAPQIPNTPPIPMEEGGFGMVTKPTLFLAGEAGREQVAFSGANRTFGQQSTAGQARPTVFNFTIQAWDGEDVKRVLLTDPSIKKTLGDAAMQGVELGGAGQRRFDARVKSVGR